MRVLLVATLALLLANQAFSQRIAAVDLIQKLEPDRQTEKPKATPLPEGCDKPENRISDGVVLLQDEGPRKISLALTSLSDRNPKLGSEVVAEIQFKNIGKQAISILWSTDPTVMKRDQNPDRLEWEQGGFEIILEGRRKNDFIILKSPELPLYGSKFSPGSLLTVQPGEWVIAKMNFKIEARYFGMPEGESLLSVRWEQASRTWTRNKCGVSTGWYDYNAGFYKQEHPTVTIQVSNPEPLKNSTLNKE